MATRKEIHEKRYKAYIAKLDKSAIPVRRTPSPAYLERATERENGRIQHLEMLVRDLQHLVDDGHKRARLQVLADQVRSARLKALASGSGVITDPSYHRAIRKFDHYLTKGNVPAATRLAETIGRIAGRTFNPKQEQTDASIS